MNSLRTLKTWTIVLHGLIILGMGHGIIPLFLIEIILLPGLLQEAGETFQRMLAIGAMLAIAGQGLIVVSMFAKKYLRKAVFHIAGIITLWLSIGFLIYCTTIDNGFVFLTVSAIPFLICTIITFYRYGKHYLKESSNSL